MSKIVKVEVPDIGDFSEVDIIEVLVEAGSVVAEEDALITLESDKATIEIPSPSAGIIKEVMVKVNGKVSQGDVILTMELAGKSTAVSKEKDTTTATEPEAPATTPESTAMPSGDMHALAGVFTST